MHALAQKLLASLKTMGTVSAAGAVAERTDALRSTVASLDVQCKICRATVKWDSVVQLRVGVGSAMLYPR
jgi:hypothetical protein